jgi:putative nucleotidyltransferase with HDIG domain
MTKSSARRAYLWIVIVVGLLAVADAAGDLRWYPLDPRWVVLCVLTLVGAVAMLKMRAAPVSFSISDTFTFTTLLLLGPAPATITAALEALALSCFLSPGQRRISRALFNVAAVGLAMWVSGTVLGLFEGGEGAGSLVAHPTRLAIATAAAVGTYFLANTWIVALAVAFEQDQPVVLTWRTHFVHLGLASAAGAYIAFLLALFAPLAGLQAFVMLAPMPLVLYISGRIWLGRVNDRVTHLDTVNRQYRATIEALAHAIDAKDQVTHGHIRRVQQASLQLARALGCVDEGQLHAIEAASLLHDLGKLAIPEHILNKPGRLTDAEYATMKEHARIGAEILAGVDFPYPVVPIVRHHHENWDGTGYPDKLAGETIPLGARILAVVDCFDALTSDRPYRRALSSVEAIDILRQRRATMYDPAVVDVFVTMVPSVESSAAPSPATAAPAAVTRVAIGESWIQLHDDERFAALAGPVLAVACRTTSASAGVVFTYLEEFDALAPAVAVGLETAALKSLHMRLGERLSGWVASSREGQRNADARLDLHETTLRAAISTPIVDGDRLVGVMTLYGRNPDSFTHASFDVLDALVSAMSLARPTRGAHLTLAAPVRQSA